LLTDFVCLYNYEFGLSLCKIVRSSVILLLPLFNRIVSSVWQLLCHEENIHDALFSRLQRSLKQRCPPSYR
jgi:hypothetical protein